MAEEKEAKKTDLDREWEAKPTGKNIFDEMMSSIKKSKRELKLKERGLEENEEYKKKLEVRKSKKEMKKLKHKKFEKQNTYVYK